MIQSDLLDIERELEENGGELTEELEAKLAITQDEFKVKVRDYTQVINQLTGDIAAINTELIRLNALKKSKQGTIDRLTQIVLYALNKFGDETNKGIKYVDWGTGKVQIRRSQKVEVNEDNVRYVGDTFMNNLLYNNYCNQLDDAEAVDVEAFVDEINNTPTEDGTTHTITKDELNNININFDIDVPLGKLVSGNEFVWLKKLIQTFSTYKTTANVNKTMAKSVLKAKPETLNNIAKIVDNETLTIK